MRVIDLENIQESMNNETQFVLRCEEVFHDKISGSRGYHSLQQPAYRGADRPLRQRQDHLRHAAEGLS